MTISSGAVPKMFVVLDMFGWVCQAGGMKKQASDQSFHDRRYQERKRAEAAKKAAPKKVIGKPVGAAGRARGGHNI
jgi:hypothetical protein